MRSHAYLCAVVVAAATVATQAKAFERPETQSVAVRLDDLNLASAAGGAAALQRIRQAAARVCGGSSRDLLSLSFHGSVARCRAAAVEDAVRQVAAPYVTRAYFDRRTPGVSLARR